VVAQSLGARSPGQVPPNARPWLSSSPAQSLPSASSMNGRESMKPGAAPLAPDRDVVQFLSTIFYVNETDDAAVVRAIRVGSLRGSCSVKWSTQDASAMEGKKYNAGEGMLHFGPGESVRTFEVGIIDDDNFDTALEFDVLLSEPMNCVLDPRLSMSSVMILDDDLFPSNSFKEVIELHSEPALYETGFSLLWGFIRFCFVHVPTIQWKTILVLLLANLGNAYYLATIFLRVYLVDTVLNTEDPSAEDRLWVTGDRTSTAFLLGLAWVLPNFILLGTDYIEMKVLEMGFNIRYHLRVNLFRKYLRYTPESRAEVPIQDLKISIMEDIPEVVSEGYMVIFELWAMLGKIAMVSIFMLRKHPRSAIPLVIYPALIVVYLIRTYRRRLDLMAKEGEGQSDTIGSLMHVHNARRLIACFDKEAYVVRRFEDVLRQQRKLTMDLKSFDFWNGQLIPWITLLAIGTYIGISPMLVLRGTTSLGAFVATIGVYKDLGDRFSTILSGVESLSKAISPLAGLTMQFNLPTDIPQRAEVFAQRQKFALESHQQAPMFDSIPIVFSNVKIDHSPTMHTGAGCLSTQAPQGSVIHVIGPHDSGKGQILKRICELQPDGSGTIMISPHLLTLQVPHEPLFMESAGVFGNLHLVSNVEKNFNRNVTARGKRIMQRLGLDKEWIMAEYESEEAAYVRGAENEVVDKAMSPFSCYEEEEEESAEEEDEGNKTWASQLSGSEKWRFQLARAFIYDPHVLVVHRPVDNLDDHLKETVMSLFLEFVEKRGLENNLEDLAQTQRRPRTVIFSTGRATQTSIADYVWHVTPDGIKVEKGPRSRRAAGEAMMPPGPAV